MKRFLNDLHRIWLYVMRKKRDADLDQFRADGVKFRREMREALDKLPTLKEDLAHNGHTHG